MDKAKRSGAMNSCKAQFLHCLIFDLVIVIALTCSLVYFYAYWFPSLCSIPIKQVVFLYIPHTCSSIFGPKCLFVVVNVIVIYLVGESKLVGSKLSSEACEIYDEYFKRSISIRIISRALQEKAASSQLETSLGGDQKVHEDIVEEEVKQVIRSSIEEDEEFQEVEEDPEVVVEEDQNHKDKAFKIKDNQAQEEVEVATEDDGKEKKEGEREEEIGWPAEELNRRIEEFIARVNRQRWLEEARLLGSRALVCCSA